MNVEPIFYSLDMYIWTRQFLLASEIFMGITRSSLTSVLRNYAIGIFYQK